MTAKASASQSVRLGPEIRSRIGKQLRALYDDVVNQGVPDKFADMLKNLKTSQGEEDK